METEAQLKLIDSPAAAKDTKYYASLSGIKKEVVDALIAGSNVVATLDSLKFPLNEYYKEKRKDKRFDALTKALKKKQKKTTFLEIMPFLGVPKTEGEVLRRADICRTMRYYSDINIFGDREVQIMEKGLQPICYVSYLSGTNNEQIVTCLFEHGWVPIMSPVMLIEDEVVIELWKTQRGEVSKFLVPLAGCASIYLDHGWKELERCRLEVDFAQSNGIRVFTEFEDVVDSSMCL